MSGDTKMEVVTVRQVPVPIWHGKMERMGRTASISYRHDADLPECVTRWGWRFHHLGVPTTEHHQDERYLPQFGFSVSGFPSSPVGVEWMRFETGSPIDPLVQQVPHLAFVVDDLDHELATRGLTVLTPPNPPSEGVRVAMVVVDGAPVELMEFIHPNSLLSDKAPGPVGPVGRRAMLHGT